MQPNPTETRVVTPTDETTSSLKRYQAASSSQTPSGPPNTVMHSLILLVKQLQVIPIQAWTVITFLTEQNVV